MRLWDSQGWASMAYWPSPWRDEHPKLVSGWRWGPGVQRSWLDQGQIRHTQHSFRVVNVPALYPRDSKEKRLLDAMLLGVRRGKACPADTVCFHGQQVVEKYLKALLTAPGIAFPKTHNIRTLRALLPRGTQLNPSEDEQDELTDYATGARYPGWAEISLIDSRRVVAIARRLRRSIRELLPKEALRRRKR